MVTWLFFVGSIPVVSSFLCSSSPVQQLSCLHYIISATESLNSVSLCTLIHTSVILIMLWFNFEMFPAGNNNLDAVFKNLSGDLTWRRRIIQKLRAGRLRRSQETDFRGEMRPNRDTEARFSCTSPCTWFYKLCGSRRANQLAPHMPLIPRALGILGGIPGGRWRLIRFNITFC